MLGEEKDQGVNKVELRGWEREGVEGVAPISSESRSSKLMTRYI